MRAPLAVLVGLLVGFIPAVLVRAAIRVQAEFERRPPGVALVPVVVTARALATGHVVTMDDLTMRSVPETLVTASIVKPESAAYLVNQPLAVPLGAGELVRWSDIAVTATIDGERPSEELIAACTSEMARRQLATVPSTVAALRASLSEGAP